MTRDLAPRLLDFLHQCIPSLQAAEILLFFVTRPHRSFRPEEAAASTSPPMSVGTVTDWLTQFTDCGLLRAGPHGFTYGPASTELERAVADLQLAYNERPVTLVAAIYRIADARTGRVHTRSD